MNRRDRTDWVLSIGLVVVLLTGAALTVASWF